MSNRSVQYSITDRFVIDHKEKDFLSLFSITKVSVTESQNVKVGGSSIESF